MSEKVTHIDTRHQTMVGIAKVIIGLLGFNGIAMLGLIVTGAWYASKMSSDVETTKNWLNENKRPLQNMIHDFGYETQRYGNYDSRNKVAIQPTVQINP